MLIRCQASRRAAGFSLVELMIALVVGLIVLGAVLTFTVTMLRSYSENIRSTRLTQELRTSMNLISRELRRAGFDSASVTRVLTPSNPSNFNTITDTGSSVAYQYDRGDGGWGGVPATTESRGIRLSAGTVQMSAGSGWVDVTDPSVVEVTAFVPTLIDTPFCSEIGKTEDTTVTPPKVTYQLAQGSVRQLTLCLKGRLVADPAIARQVTNTVRVRAEQVTFGDSTTTCPTLVEATLRSPAELNDIAMDNDCVDATP